MLLAGCLSTAGRVLAHCWRECCATLPLVTGNTITPSHSLPACSPLPAPQYYINRGYLIPTFHKHYWMGLVSDTSVYPKFTWSDPTVKGTYLTITPHWGSMTIVGGTRLWLLECRG